MKSDFDDRSDLRASAELARALRTSTRRFLGFEGSITSIQAKMQADFDASASMDHSGDKGTARENVLRDFLSGPYLPKRYGVSEGPSKVVATNAATSDQIDVAIFDALNAPRLLDVGGIQYFPVEAVLGVIQVKSNLSKTSEIEDGLTNIASFKKLRCAGQDVPAGFGVLFAYTATLAWSTIVKSIAQWEKDNPKTTWPNLVCVLDQASIVNTLGPRTTVQNVDLHKIGEPQLFPLLSDGAELVTFYLLLLDMLAATTLPRIPHWSYANLPMWIDGHSVRFTFGSFSQVAECADHGPYLKDLRAGAAEAIIAACVGQAKVNDFSLFRESGQDDRPVGPPNVYLFNPEGQPARDVLLHIDAFRATEDLPPRVVTGGVGVEAIEIDGDVYWVPYYYDVKLALVRHCPKCPGREVRPQMTPASWHAELTGIAEQRVQRFIKEDEEEGTLTPR